MAATASITTLRFGGLTIPFLLLPRQTKTEPELSRRHGNAGRGLAKGSTWHCSTSPDGASPEPRETRQCKYSPVGCLSMTSRCIWRQSVCCTEQSFSHAKSLRYLSLVLVQSSGTYYFRVRGDITTTSAEANRVSPSPKEAPCALVLVPIHTDCPHHHDRKPLPAPNAYPWPHLVNTDNSALVVPSEPVIGVALARVWP